MPRPAPGRAPGPGAEARRRPLPHRVPLPATVPASRPRCAALADVRRTRSPARRPWGLRGSVPRRPRRPRDRALPRPAARAVARGTGPTSRSTCSRRRSISTTCSPPIRDSPLELAAGGVDIGHVHLKVADVEATTAFWTGRPAMELMTQLRADAAFLARDGYHHHVGANTWASRGVQPEPLRGPGPRRASPSTPTPSMRRPADARRDSRSPVSTHRHKPRPPAMAWTRERAVSPSAPGPLLGVRPAGGRLQRPLPRVLRHRRSPSSGARRSAPTRRRWTARGRHGRRRGHDPLPLLAALRRGVRDRAALVAHLGTTSMIDRDHRRPDSTASRCAEGEIRHVFVELRAPRRRRRSPDDVRVGAGPATASTTDGPRPSRPGVSGAGRREQRRADRAGRVAEGGGSDRRSRVSSSGRNCSGSALMAPPITIRSGAKTRSIWVR